MATNDGRREVARRLRGQAKKLGPNMDAHEFAHYTADVIDVNECMTWYEMELRLADLIEPSEPEDFYRVTYSRSTGGSPYMLKVHSAKGDEWDFWRIDRDALLALADEMDARWLGHEGMEDSPVARWSRELREALGEAE